MVSQFVSTHNVGLLGDLDFTFPAGTHALGRLDKDSEGLLLLTTDKRATRLLFSSDVPHLRSYLLMVQNELSEKTLEQLRSGITIKIKNGQDYVARPASIQRIANATAYCRFARDKREAWPHTWLMITLTEGKYRQVRKMLLAARHRCLRLIRLSVSGVTLENLKPGEVQEMDEESFYRLLGIQPV